MALKVERMLMNFDMQPKNFTGKLRPLTKTFVYLYTYNNIYVYELILIVYDKWKFEYEG